MNRSPKALARHSLTKGKHGRLASPRTLCEVVLLEVDYEQPGMRLLSSGCTCQPNKGAQNPLSLPFLPQSRGHSSDKPGQ